MVGLYPVRHYGKRVKDDLSKAEQKWAQRRLFAPPPRRRGRWLLLAIVLFALVWLFLMSSGIHLPPL